MNKIIALNWKETQTPESAPALLRTAEDVRNIYPDYTWILFPGDDIIANLQTKIPLGKQNFGNTDLPYCLIGHMSRRHAGQTDEEIQKQIEQIKATTTIPIFCVGPMKEEDTLELVLKNQLVVLDAWPKEKEIIVAYEPGFAIGTGKTMTLEDIEVIYDILSKALEWFKNKQILYGGSVNDTNIAQILSITDGVIIGTASQKSSTLLSLSIALWQI